MNERNFDNISDKKNFITLTFYDAEKGEIYDIECSSSDKLIDVVKKKMKRWQYVYHDFIYENRIVRELNNIKEKTPIGLCHNYLTKDNVIYRHDSTFLINFELANINYTYFDLASFIFENKLSEESIDTFLSTYFGASYNSLKKKRVMTFLEFYKGYMYYMYQCLYSITGLDKYKKLSEKVY